MTEEENKENVENGNVDDSAVDYIAAMKELKENTVARSEYEKVKAENKRILDEVINGRSDSKEESKAKHSEEDIKRLRSELYGPDAVELSNLDYISKTLELRDALIEKGELDPFIPIGKQINPTMEDFVTAEAVAKTYRECVEFAKGDSEVFTNELMRRTKDNFIPKPNFRR